MIIYLLTFPSGKHYIGQTVRMLATRISQHRQAANAGSLLPVHCAWRKHGEPSVSVLGEYGDMERLHAAEVAFIASYGSVSPGGYNVSFGGDTAPSKSPDVARKISAKAKGRGHSEAACAKIAVASKAKWEDEAYRAKVEAGIAASWTPERRAHAGDLARERHTGRVVSEATKDKLRGRKFSDEARAKMSASAKARKRKPFTAETRAKISENTRRAWQNEEVTARRLVAQRKAMSSPEFSEKMSEVAKSTWADPEVRQRRVNSLRKKD